MCQQKEARVLQEKLFSCLVVFVGAGIGGVCRFLMSPAVQKLFANSTFPIGTFSVNMVGCLVIGILAQLAESRGLFTGDTRAFVFVGILGGYTTFSSFGYETFQLLRSGEYLYAALNAGLQVVLGILLVWVGSILVKLAVG
jgi:CrcB protein